MGDYLPSFGRLKYKENRYRNVCKVILDVVEKRYRGNVCIRYDEGIIPYFKHENFPELHFAPYSFYGSEGQRLQGYFYYYDNPIPGRLVVFDHGLGGGHTAYLQEVNVLAKHGYLVFAYDHTGCMESEGADTNGLAQSLTDLNECIKALKTIDDLKDRTISVVGHSWGGFSTVNIGALYPEITHLAILSPIISIKQMLKQSMRDYTVIFRGYVRSLERKWNPRFADTDGIESLKKTNAKVLVIQSRDDPTVNPKFHFDLLKKELKDHENIAFIEVENKGHNPNYTLAAAEYKRKFFAALREAEDKKAHYASGDYWQLTEQDPEVWEMIFRHLDS